MSDILIGVELTHPDAKTPKYSHTGDAGADVYSVERRVIWAGTTAVIDLGIKLEIPDGWEVQVRSRSGLAAKHGIFVLNAPGTIDSGYRGPCKVMLHNSSRETYTVEVGERIAQFVIKRAPQADFHQINKVGETERGSGGFGSTGKK